MKTKMPEFKTPAFLFKLNIFYTDVFVVLDCTYGNTVRLRSL
jgi:hypothetical protein